MNPRFLLLISLAAFLLSAPKGPAKPPTRAKPEPQPSPTTAAAAVTQEGSGSLLRWLLLQNGGSTAAAIPWPEIVRATSGRQVIPFEPAGETDAKTMTTLTALLDASLPRLNRPEGPLRATPTLTSGELAARVADDLRAALVANPGSAVEPSAGSTIQRTLCPMLRWSEGPGSRPCYLVVAVYPADGKDEALRALTIRAADLAGQITTNGPCLLIGIQHNGKSGRDLALLNWEIIDLARLSLRCAVTFETDGNALHAPGATVADGRRGRD